MKASTASHAGTFLATLPGGALAIITLRWQGRDDIAVRASVIATGYTLQGVAVRATFTNDGLSGATVPRLVDLLEIHTSIGRVQVHVGIQFAAWEGNRTFAPRR